MVQCPRGTRDFLPDELEKRRAYEGTLRSVARRFGFREIQTPIFEEAELFILRSGPNVLKELYAFKDKGDRDLALRPEMTAAVVRAFVNGMSNDPKPIKVFYFGPCFRYERPQAGRYREFYQFGAKIMGAATPELWETLLTPTAIYVKPVLSLLNAGIAVRGISHVTGGGFYENIPRSLGTDCQAVIPRANVRVLDGAAEIVFFSHGVISS